MTPRSTRKSLAKNSAEQRVFAYTIDHGTTKARPDLTNALFLIGMIEARNTHLGAESAEDQEFSGASGFPHEPGCGSERSTMPMHTPITCLLASWS